MKKLLAGLTVTGAAALVAITGATPAQAYPDTNPKGTKVESAVAGNGAQAGALPNTGGPDSALLAGGGALLLVGGATVVASRRRRAS